MEKNNVFNHSPSLFDAPGTEAQKGMIVYISLSMMTIIKALKVQTAGKNTVDCSYDNIMTLSIIISLSCISTALEAET